MIFQELRDATEVIFLANKYTSTFNIIIARRIKKIKKVVVLMMFFLSQQRSKQGKLTVITHGHHVMLDSSTNSSQGAT